MFAQHLFTLPVGAPANLHFRLVEAGDLRPLHTHCYPERPWRQFCEHFQRIRQWQENGRACWLVIESKQPGDQAPCLVGSGQLLLYPHGAELANLVVRPDQRSQGIGTAMIQVFTRVARHLHLGNLEIGVSTSNARARALYLRLGFTEDRHLRLPNGETAVILVKDL